MDRLITIINPCGSGRSGKTKGKTMRKKRNASKRSLALAARAKARKKPTRRKKAVAKKTTSKKRKTTMAKKRRVARGKRVRPVLYKSRSGWRRPKNSRYFKKPTRINPKRRYRKRRNPAFLKGIRKFSPRKYFGAQRMSRALGIVVGLGAGAVAKNMLNKVMPNPMLTRAYGVLAIIAGATLNMKGRKAMTKSAGTGLVVYGVLDALITNIPALAAYFPAISGPAAFSGLGYDAYGRSVMGASVNAGPVEVVGANISSQIDPEIIGEEMDLADVLEAGI